MEKKMNTKAVAALFIYGLIVYASNYTMGVLGKIMAAYPNVAPSTVQSVLVGPALIGTIYAYFFGSLNKKFNAKTLMLFAEVTLLAYGVIFCFLGGKAPIAILIIASGLVGFNQGSMNTITGLILVKNVADEGTRGSILGILTAVMNLGGVVIVNIAGRIASGSTWQSGYYVFFYLIIAILATIFLLPNTEPEGKEVPAGAAGGEAVSAQAPVKAWIISIHYFFFFLFLYVYGTNCSEYIQTTYKLGAEAEGAFAASTITIGGVVAGFAYGIYSKILKKWTVPVLMGLAAIGITIPVFITNSLLGIYTAGILGGFAMMGCNPYIIGYMNQIAPGPAFGKAMSVFSTFMNAGMVVAIYVIAFLTKLICGDAGDIHTKFVVGMVGLILTFVTSIPIYGLAKEK